MKCIPPVQHNEPLHPPVLSSSKIPDAIRCLIGIFNPQILPTVEVDNIIIDIAECISHKITKMVCSKWAAGLVVLLNEANSSQVFSAAKQYQYPSTRHLVVSSSDLMEMCILIEAKFCNNTEKILHMNKVSSILGALMLSKIQ